MAITFIKPFTDIWVRERLMCFTSSEMIRLCKGGSRKMTKAEIEAKKIQDKKDKANNIETNSRRTVDTLFGDGAISYINEKVCEAINKQAKYTPITAPMQWGLSWEDDAIKYLSMVTGINFRSCGFFKVNSFLGGSPDAISGIRKVKYTAEAKCLNADRHSEICELQNSDDLREYDEGYWVQCQTHCLVTGAKACFFCSFDPRPMGYKDNGEIDEDLYDPEKWIYCIKVIKVKRDEVFLKELEMRVDKASDIVIKKIEKRIKSANANKTKYERLINKAA